LVGRFISRTRDDATSRTPITKPAPRTPGASEALARADFFASGPSCRFRFDLMRRFYLSECPAPFNPVRSNRSRAGASWHCHLLGHPRAERRSPTRRSRRWTGQCCRTGGRRSGGSVKIRPSRAGFATLRTCFGGFNAPVQRPSIRPPAPAQLFAANRRAR